MYGSNHLKSHVFRMTGQRVSQASLPGPLCQIPILLSRREVSPGKGCFIHIGIHTQPQCSLDQESTHAAQSVCVAVGLDPGGTQGTRPRKQTFCTLNRRRDKILILWVISLRAINLSFRKSCIASVVEKEQNLRNSSHSGLILAFLPRRMEEPFQNCNGWTCC